jgi:PTS system ascorbate-specific IIA component
MVGILLLAHAPLASAFISAAAHVFKVCPDCIEALDVRADQDPAEVRRLADAAVQRLERGAGVLVITDVMGGTPSNCTKGMAREGKVEVIAGLSLPMLLRAITYRSDTLAVMAEMALAGGQSGAVVVEHRIRLAVG